jgi:hypothetical protein
MNQARQYMSGLTWGLAAIRRVALDHGHAR